jgi:hypothetical protein
MTYLGLVITFVEQVWVGVTLKRTVLEVVLFALQIHTNLQV